MSGTSDPFLSPTLIVTPGSGAGENSDPLNNPFAATPNFPVDQFLSPSGNASYAGYAESQGAAAGNLGIPGFKGAGLYDFSGGSPQYLGYTPPGSSDYSYLPSGASVPGGPTGIVPSPYMGYDTGGGNNTGWYSPQLDANGQDPLNPQSPYSPFGTGSDAGGPGLQGGGAAPGQIPGLGGSLFNALTGGGGGWIQVVEELGIRALLVISGGILILGGFYIAGARRAGSMVEAAT